VVVLVRAGRETALAQEAPEGVVGEGGGAGAGVAGDRGEVARLGDDVAAPVVGLAQGAATRETDLGRALDRVVAEGQDLGRRQGPAGDETVGPVGAADRP
jgi:hypothetical protein